MNDTDKDLYYNGYVAGFRDGIKAAASGKSIPSEHTMIEALPIPITKLSTRAKNCLLRSGCNCIRDAASLPKERIATLRNAGPKTVSEIARYLDSLGIRYSDWNTYL